MEGKEMVYVGIDPGKSGAIAVLNRDGIEIFSSVVPKIGKEYDRHAVLNILRRLENKYEVRACLEDINGHVAKGRTTAFIMGAGKEMWEMALTACEIRYTRATPQKWQKVSWEGVPIQYVTSVKNKSGKKKDTKKTSEIAFKRLFPNSDVYVTDNGGKSKNAHDGLIDAYLIAEYCRIKNNV